MRTEEEIRKFRQGTLENILQAKKRGEPAYILMTPILSVMDYILGDSELTVEDIQLRVKAARLTSWESSKASRSWRPACQS